MHMKKQSAAALLLALALCLGLPRPASAVDAGYSDVPEDHWAAESIAQATQLGLFFGVGDGQFGLGQSINRAGFATALGRLFGWEETRPTKNTYADVPTDAWYYSAVETAAANGALGASELSFRPLDDITREEMAAMLIRSLGYTSLAGIVSTYSSPFSDVTTNKGFITLAYDMGIIGGVGDGLFDPAGTATREQAAAILVRVHERLSARSIRLAYAGSYDQIKIDTPQAVPGDELPTTPLEPMMELYSALRQRRDSGADMKRVVLCLTSGGIRTTTEADGTLSSTPITAKDVEAILARDDVKLYYSDRYECPYCIYTTEEGQEATLWYQSDESLAAKLQLARLFGATRYYMI